MARRPIFPPERYDHGTRARYSVGCRCTRCREAKAIHTRERDAQARVAALALPAGAATGMCPGVKGAPCPSGARLVAKSVGGVCRRCRERLISNPLVDAAAMREHVRMLSESGVGRKAVATRARVAQSVIARVMSGEQLMVRSNIAESVLSVNETALADGARVPAGPTVRLVKKMLAMGLTKTEIARRLGGGRTKLQFSATRVRVSTARAIERLWREVRMERRKKPEAGAKIGPFVLERTACGIVQRRIA